MKKIVLIFFVSLMSDMVSAQYSYMLPGENTALDLEIQRAVNRRIGSDYRLAAVLNIDSCLGQGLSPRWPQIGPVENPYGTLTHCIVFTAIPGAGSNVAVRPYDIVGIFKDGSIIWNSTTEIPSVQQAISGGIWAVKDINRDGKVDVMSTWLQQDGTDAMQGLWIVSWNGRRGEIINSLNNDSTTSIVISANSDFSLADINGDGIWEIQGESNPQSAQDSSRISEESAMVLRTFSWNGSRYGYWPNTAQPTTDKCFPRDGLAITVSATVSKNDQFKYGYSIENRRSSFQCMDEFLIPKKVDKIIFLPTREFWNVFATREDMISWGCYGIEGINYLAPGAEDSAFALKVQSQSLPSIQPYYARGHNGEPCDTEDFLSNSFSGKTVVPNILPQPLEVESLLDTLFSYKQQSVALGWLSNDKSRERECERTIRGRDWYKKHEVRRMRNWKVDDSLDFDKNWNNGIIGILDNRLEKAKQALMREDSVKARRELQIFVMEVDLVYSLGEKPDVRSKKQEARNKKSEVRGQKPVMTGEAYALLKYNAEYLIDRLPTKHKRGRK